MNLHDLEAELIRGLEMGTWAAAKVSMQIALRMVQAEMAKADEQIKRSHDIILSRTMTGTSPNECVASGTGCSYRPYGPNGEWQCQWCGESRP